MKQQTSKPQLNANMTATRIASQQQELQFLPRHQCRRLVLVAVGICVFLRSFSSQRDDLVYMATATNNVGSTRMAVSASMSKIPPTTSAYSSAVVEDKGNHHHNMYIANKTAAHTSFLRQTWDWQEYYHVKLTTDQATAAASAGTAERKLDKTSQPTTASPTISTSGPTERPTSAPTIGPTGSPVSTTRTRPRDYVQQHEHEYPRLCGGCTMKVVPSAGLRNPQHKRPMTCGDWMDQNVLEKQKKKVISNITSATAEDYLQAAREIAQLHPSYCHRCDPDHCPDHDANKQYLSLDIAGPKINRASTPWFSSLPAHDPTKNFSRFPLQAFDDFQNYFADENNLQTNRRYAVDMNPSIIPIPKDQIPQYLTPQQKREVVYLASFRVSNAHDCFPEALAPITMGQGQNKKEFNRLGLALLREDLTVIDDVVLETSKSLGDKSDYRLFLLRGQMYLTTFTRIAPIWLNKPSLHNNTHHNGSNNTILERKDLFDPDAHKMTMYLREVCSCCQSTRCGGKNFQYFESQNKVYVETRPMAPHTVEVVDLNAPCVKNAKNNSLLFLSESMPNETSFFTNDEYYFSSKGHHTLPYQPQSGTAGILRIQTPSSNGKQEGGEELFVGVSHRKIHGGQRSYRDQNNLSFALRQYVSHFYAFRPEPPFDVVAVSGAFCLGYPEDRELSSAKAPNKLQHVILEWLRKRPLIMAEQELDCPFITFVTGMTQSPIDPNKVVLGYGVNDCMSRFVEIDKSEIVRLLFPNTTTS